jgi:hypothetical protein
MAYGVLTTKIMSAFSQCCMAAGTHPAGVSVSASAGLNIIRTSMIIIIVVCMLELWNNLSMEPGGTLCIAIMVF